MKKLLLTLVALVLSSVMMAGNFVMINYSGQAELQRIFNDSNLTVHYYNDSQVFATAEQFDAKTMVMLDENAFAENDVYTLVYCPQTEQQAYLQDGVALCQTANFVVVKGAVMPYKNDGAIAIFNKAARLPQRNRDFPSVTEENPIIREMMDQVNMDSLEATVQHLQDYHSRLWNSDNAFAASDWIAGRMEALGLEVEQQPFYVSTWTGSGQAAPNVIGIQRGTVYPDTYVVCGSHFDSFSYSGNCPGADDNATGVASVLETARILTKYEFEYSIVYCAYGCEEMGLYGSEAYASRCQQEGMDIIGYFNNDMNGYLYGDVIHIDCIYPTSVAPIGDYYMNVADVYFPGMPVQRANLSGGDSDHTSFNYHGYMGIYPFEDVNNYSPYIHTSNDLIGNSVNSFGMSQRYCQMNIGCLTEIANPIGVTPVVECNPIVNFLYGYDYPVEKIVLGWEAPLEGSTGELERFDLYRDGQLLASLSPDALFYEDPATEDDLPLEYYINAVYSDGCEALSDTLVVEGPNGVWEQSTQVSVYPNPTTDLLNIKADGLQRVIIFNVMGQQVAIIEAKQNEISLETSHFPSGLYTIQIVTDRGVASRSIIVK